MAPSRRWAHPKNAKYAEFGGASVVARLKEAAEKIKSPIPLALQDMPDAEEHMHAEVESVSSTPVDLTHGGTREQGCTDFGATPNARSWTEGCGEPHATLQDEKVPLEAAEEPKSTDQIASLSWDKNVDNTLLELFHAENPEKSEPQDVEAFEEQLNEAVKHGFTSRDPLGQRFRKEEKKDESLSKEFSDCKTHLAKQQFRVQWAKRKLAEIQILRAHNQSYQIIDKSRGAMMPFGRIVEQYGCHYDMQAAVQAAIRYTTKCAIMKGDWAMYDEMAEVMLFLFIDRRHDRIMTESWNLYEKEHSSSRIADERPIETDAAVPAVAESETAVCPKAAPQTTRKLSKTVNEAPASNTALKPPPSTKLKSTLDCAFAKMNTVRNRINTADCSARRLLEVIADDTSNKWTWAKNNENRGALERAHMDMLASLSDFSKMYLIKSMKDTRASYTQEELTVNLSSAEQTEPTLSTLEKTLSRMRRMCKAFEQ